METMIFGKDGDSWSVTFSDTGLIWKAWHTWSEDTTDRVDGYLLNSNGDRRQLDIASLSDECCLINKPVDQVQRATEAWNEGLVFMADPEHHGVDTLVVPFPALNTKLIHEALRRFKP